MSTKVWTVQVVSFLAFWTGFTVGTGLIRKIGNDIYIEDLDEGPDKIIAIYDHEISFGYESHAVTQEFDCRLLGVARNSQFVSVGRDSSNVQCRTATSITSQVKLDRKTNFRTYFNTIWKQYFFTSDGLLQKLDLSLAQLYNATANSCPFTPYSQLPKINSDQLVTIYSTEVAARSPNSTIWIGAFGTNENNFNDNDVDKEKDYVFRWYHDNTEVNFGSTPYLVDYTSSGKMYYRYGLALKKEGKFRWAAANFRNYIYLCSYKIFEHMSNWPWA